MIHKESLKTIAKTLVTAMQLQLDLLRAMFVFAVFWDLFYWETWYHGPFFILTAEP